jgi:hypothetical protein
LLVIDGNAAHRVFHIRSSVVTISGLAITNGYSAYGGGGCEQNSWLFRIARILVRFDHVANVIVKANHCVIAFEIEPTED